MSYWLEYSPAERVEQCAYLSYIVALYSIIKYYDCLNVCFHLQNIRFYAIQSSNVHFEQNVKGYLKVQTWNIKLADIPLAPNDSIYKY